MSTEKGVIVSKPKDTLQDFHELGKSNPSGAK